MFDDTPWFRRWMRFSFLPITWQGWATTGAVLVVEIALMLMQPQPESNLWWLLAFAGFTVFLAFWALVLWKSEPS